MSDLDKFLELYRSVGVEPEVKQLENFTVLRLVPCDSSKVMGYNMFYTEINFDENGKFINQGIWE